MNITIIGDGGWGTAIGLLLHSYGHRVTLWGPFAEYLDEIRASRENSRYLPGIALPDDLRWIADPAGAVAGAEAVVLAVPSKFYSSVCASFAGLITTPGTLVVSLTKGLCEKTHRRMSEIARSTLGLDTIAVLSGPSHAEEVARGIPTAVVAAADDEAIAQRAQQLFNGPLFRVYTSTDTLGVEIGGAVKNVIAIAVGASDGPRFRRQHAGRTHHTRTGRDHTLSVSRWRARDLFRLERRRRLDCHLYQPPQPQPRGRRTPDAARTSRRSSQHEDGG